MQALDPAGNYTDAEVIDVLTAQRGGRRMTYRYDRLDDLNRYVGPVDWVIGGKLANNALADIKRTATFTILDRGGINYLKDRIMPFARLDMPTTYVDVPPTFTEWAEARRNLIAYTKATSSAVPTGWSVAGGSTQGDWVLSKSAGVTTPYIFAGRAQEAIAIGDELVGEVEVQADTDAIPYVRVNVHRRTGNVYFTGEGVQVIVPLQPGVPVKVPLSWVSTAAIPADDLDISVVPCVESGAFTVPPAGAVFRARRVIYARGPEPVDYFDGDTRPVGTLNRSRWLGAANASMSVWETRAIDVPGHREPDGRPGFVEWPLGVFLLATPARTVDEVGIVQREVQAFDQLLVLMQDKVADRYSINAGVKYTDAIDTLTFGLNRAISPSSVTLSTAREWEPGTSKLRILNDLLAAINYESAWFDELGRLICRPYLSPADRTSEYTFADGQWSVRTGDAEQVLDLFDVPNRWVLVKSEADEAPLTSIYTNDDPSSPTSTVSRGRIIVDFRDNEDAADQASLDAKAARYAFEASQIYERMTINTAVMPMCSNADVVTLGLPDLAVDAKYTGHTWEYDMRAGAVMKHTVRRVVAV